MRAFAVFSAVLLTSGFVRPDYPPPSEEGHEYYGSDGGGASPSRTAGGMSFVGDWSDKDWQVLSAYNRPKCLDIPANLTLCRNIGYGQMRLPNLLEHDTLREATQQASSWVRLTHVGCHPDTQVFLCSLFAPVCLDQPVAPCRSLCEAVKAGCENRMLQYGFPWPDMLRCDRFPSGTDLCIGIRNQQDTEDDNGAVCPPCILPTDVSPADVLDSLCQADFVIRAKVEQSLVIGNDVKIITAKKKIFRSAETTTKKNKKTTTTATGTPPKSKLKELRTGFVYLEGGADCDCPALDTVNGQRSDDQVVIAGTRTADHRLVASFVQNARGKAIRSVLRDLRGKDACRGGSGGGNGLPGGKLEENNREKNKGKKGMKNDGRSGSRSQESGSRSHGVGEEQEEEEEEGGGEGKIESKNQKVRNKGPKAAEKTSGEDTERNKNNDRDNNNNRKKDNGSSDNRRKGNRNDNARDNKATTGSQTTSTQNPRESGRQQKNERNQRMGVMTSARPTKKVKGVTHNRNRPV